MRVCVSKVFEYMSVYVRVHELGSRVYVSIPVIKKKMRPIYVFKRDL